MDGAEAARIMYGQGIKPTGEKTMSRSKLKAVRPEAASPSKPKILIYGKPGVGKTWTALDFPGCYYIDTEGGADLSHYTEKLKNSGGVYYGVEQGSLDFANVIGQIQALATEKHEYRTVIIDSITKIFNNEVAKEADKLGDKDVFGASKKPAVAMIRQLISWIQRLDMNVILIAHEKVLWGMVNNQRAEVGVTFDCYDKLEYELHLALNIVKLPSKRNALVKKSRLPGFEDGAAFEWSYQEFAKRYGRDILEKEATQLILATEDQLTEIKYLLSIVKLPEGQSEKWLTAANAASWEEMDSDKLAKTIIHVKDKYIPKSNQETK